jgi:hypothetical protein
VRKLIIATLLLLLIPASAYARIGVGVATGRIEVTEELKPGIIYELPSLTIVNTGDEGSDYEASIEYHQDQKELSPAKEWFSFSPKKFYLEPGETKTVNIKLNLPINAEPGDYFAYLEGHPLKKSQSGSTTIGVAAAAKLYFTIAPANIFQGIYYKIVSLWNIYQPWTTWISIVLGTTALLVAFKKFFNIEINRKSKKENTSEDKQKEPEKRKEKNE